MMILQFISQNKDLIGLIAVSIAGLFVFIKWIDNRNRELKEKRYKTYMDLIGVISGKRIDSSTPNLTEQIAAVWFLLEYKEYYEITKKYSLKVILKIWLMKFGCNTCSLIFINCSKKFLNR